jgi:hypothetical protein
VSSNNITVNVAMRASIGFHVTFKDPNGADRTEAEAFLEKSTNSGVSWTAVTGASAFAYLRNGGNHDQDTASVSNVIVDTSAGHMYRVRVKTTGASLTTSTLANSSGISIMDINGGGVGPTGPTGAAGSSNELDGQILEVITRSTAYANGTYEGHVVKYGSDTLVTGKFYVYTSSGWTAVDADVEAKTHGLFGLALGTSSATDGLLVRGIHSSTAHSGFTAGQTLYVSTTEGTISSTAPSATGDFLRVVGYAMGSNYIYLDPSQDYIELA